MSSQEFSLSGETVDENQFFDDNLQTWVDDTIIADTKSIARAANLPEIYINSIKFLKTGFAKGRVVNTHEAWKFIEWGTKPHTITTKGGPNARSPPRKLKLPPNGPGNRFPSIVDHPGNRPFLIMTKGKAMGFPRFKALVKSELDAFRGQSS